MTTNANDERAVTFGDPEVQAGFTPMPNQILINSPDLGADELLCYLAIASFAWGDKDTSFSGNESIAGRARMSVKRVIAAKRRLVEAGYLEEKRRGLGMTNLHVLWLKSRARTAARDKSRTVDGDSSRTGGCLQTKTDKVNTNKVNQTRSSASAAQAAPATGSRVFRPPRSAPSQGGPRPPGGLPRGSNALRRRRGARRARSCWSGSSWPPASTACSRPWRRAHGPGHGTRQRRRRDCGRCGEAARAWRSCWSSSRPTRRPSAGQGSAKVLVTWSVKISTKRDRRASKKKPGPRYQPGTCGFPTKAGGLCQYPSGLCPWPQHDRSGMTRLQLRGWERR